MSQIQMNASAVGGTIYGAFGTYPVPASGLITVDSRDAANILAIGGFYIGQAIKTQGVGAVRLATAGRLVASVALANGTLTIANQPDFPRQAGLRVDPGTTAITAGVANVAYVANDGTTMTDTISLAAAASTPFTQNTTKGVVKLNSVIITGLVGGTSPLTQLNDTNSLSVLVEPGFAGFNVLKEMADAADETIGTVASSAASITPTTLPNGTHTYSFVVGYSAPNA